MEWRAQSRRVTLTSCVQSREPLEPRDVVCSQVSRFMCTVLVLVVKSSFGVGRLIVRFHHAYAISSFLLDVVVPTLSCHRQLRL